jgi:FMN phosphatase YigB (HAD superfamily)
VMYVGDNPLHDILPPKGLGMITTWSSRAARQTLEQTGVSADHTVADFAELRELLREQYGISV